MEGEKVILKQRIHDRVKTRVATTWHKTMESDRTINFIIFVFIIVATAMIIELSFVSINTKSVLIGGVPPKKEAPVVAGVQSATFRCTRGKSIVAEFSQNEVRLDLSDGRGIILPQVISGSGARYANPDESFVFWNKGDTAFVDEFGDTTYEACITEKS